MRPSTTPVDEGCYEMLEMATRVEERAAAEHQEGMRVTEADGGDGATRESPPLSSVRATLFFSPSSVAVAIASWWPDDVVVTLAFDWAYLKLRTGRSSAALRRLALRGMLGGVRLRAAHIATFQPGRIEHTSDSALRRAHCMEREEREELRADRINYVI